MNKLYELNNVEQHYDGKKVLGIENLALEENQIIGFLVLMEVGNQRFFHCFHLLINQLLVI